MKMEFGTHEQRQDVQLPLGQHISSEVHIKM